MKRTIIIASTVVLVSMLWSPAPVGWADTAKQPPPAGTALAAKSPAALAEAGRLRQAAIEQAIGGDFSGALARLGQAEKIVPDDDRTETALSLMKSYLTERERDESARRADYANAVRRVRQCMLAQKHIHALKKDTLDEKIRKQITEAVEAHGRLPDSEAVGLATEEELGKLKAEADKALKAAGEALRKGQAVFKGRKGPYAETFRGAVARAMKAIETRRGIWSSLSGATSAQRHASAKRVRDSEDDLAGMLGEIESMIVAKPWRPAVMYGRMARELSDDRQKLKDVAWYKALVADTEARGRNAMANAEWHDALAAYSGLKDLMPDNADYKASAKVVQRHVRVLRLYGNDGSETNANGETGGRTWKDYVAKVDKDMIEKIITRLGRYYVKSVDYRKITRSALTSVKVLVETPQAAKTFGKLKDEALRKAMLAVIDAEFNAVKNRDRVDQLDLSLALSNVLNASDRTVQIPLEVIAVEFADGFLSGLDRFSSMIWPYEVEDFNKQTMGKFFGVGVQITKQPKSPLKVVTPLAGSPAMKAGIRTGDSIFAVDYGEGMKKTADVTIDACVKMITGKEGTTVKLQIKRDGKLLDKPISVVRAKISVHTVAGWRRLSDGGWDFMLDPSAKIGYVRLKQFTDTTTRDLVEALTELRRRGSRSVILDLRGNPGGLLREAGTVTDQFLAGGRIVSTRGRLGLLHAPPIKAGRNGAFIDGDLVVLISQHSASAAEIVSGALRELGRGLIVGRRTFGKGSVQNVIPIPKHEAFLKLTTARYYVGNNEKLVHRENGSSEWGVDPHVKVPMTPRLARLLMTIRRKTEVIRNAADDEAGRKLAAQQLSEDLSDQYKADNQLRTGVLLLKLMRLRGSKAPA